MKKLLLSVYFLAIIGFIGYAQSLSLSKEGSPVPNNSNVVFAGSYLDPEIVSDVDVTNNSGSAINVLVKKVEISILPGTTNTFCWGLCFPPNIYVSPEPIQIAAGATNDIDFSGHYYPAGVAGLSIIRYVFFDQQNPSDSVCFNSHFDALVGIADLEGRVFLSNASPNPANNQTSFGYSLPADVKATVVFRNVLGSPIQEVPVPGTSGILNVQTGELSEGVYFYSLVVNGKTYSTRKLIVSH
ncbi:MAG: T9SS type A sorting domain-containing protein [bacterium]